MNNELTLLPREAPPRLKRSVKKADGSWHHSLLTVERHEIICDAFKKGASNTAAASYAGIAPETIDKWRRRGREAWLLEEEGHDVDHETIYAEFERGICSSLSEFERGHLENIDDHSETHWAASKWLLERRLPKEWAQKEQQQIQASPQFVEFSVHIGDRDEEKGRTIEVNAVEEHTILIEPGERNEESDG